MGLSQDVREKAPFTLYGEAAAESTYGLVNAFTEVAQRLPGESRYELEALAATLIDTTASSVVNAALRRRTLGIAD